MANFYVALDCETGGLDPAKTDLLTIFLGVFDEEFKLVDELDLKLKPDGGRLPIAEAGALRVNGINLAEHLASPDAITYSEGKAKIETMLRKYHKKGRYSNLIPLGHNIPFDLNFIYQYLFPKDEWNRICHYRTVDTNPIVGFLKDVGWFPKDLGSLESVVEHLGVPKRAAHNAKEDTLMCVDAYKALIAFMKSQRNSGSSANRQQDLISLLEAE